MKSFEQKPIHTAYSSPKLSLVILPALHQSWFCTRCVLIPFKERNWHVWDNELKIYRIFPFYVVSTIPTNMQIVGIVIVLGLQRFTLCVEILIQDVILRFFGTKFDYLHLGVPNLSHPHQKTHSNLFCFVQFGSKLVWNERGSNGGLRFGIPWGLNLATFGPKGPHPAVRLEPLTTKYFKQTSYPCTISLTWSGCGAWNYFYLPRSNFA